MEEILKKLGDPGCYHILLAILFAITWWSVCLGNVSMAFYGFTPDKTCNIMSTLQHTNISLTEDIMNNITVSEDQCNLTIYYNGGTTTEKCTSWFYDDEGRGTSTVATEWDLVCENSYKISLSSTIFFVGVFCGAFIFGFISDHLGRKKTLAICLYTQMPISLGVAFMPDYISFTIMRFVLGVWLQGISTVAYVHCIEFFRQKYRGVVMIVFGMSWAFGQLLTVLLAYLLPNWKHMQMASAAVAMVTIPYFWWLPESPRWLFVKSRFEEITDIFITRAAKTNRLNIKEMTSWASLQLDQIGQKQALAASTEQTQSFINILKTPILRKRLLAMCYMWCVSSMTYYVFILNSANLVGDRYLNFALGAVVEIVINFAIIFVMTRFGRKRPLLAFSVLIVVFCIILGVLGTGRSDNKTISVLIIVFASLGKMAIAAVMCLIFVYAAELFPTFARGSCLAICGCSLRLGGILAPWVVYLRESLFPQFPYLVIAVLVGFIIVTTVFLPETLGRNMPNTIQEAVEMLPVKDISKGSGLLDSSTGTHSSDSETCSSNSEQEKIDLNQEFQNC